MDRPVEFAEFFDARETGWPSIFNACCWLAFTRVKYSAGVSMPRTIPARPCLADGVRADGVLAGRVLIVDVASHDRTVQPGIPDSSRETFPRVARRSSAALRCPSRERGRCRHRDPFVIRCVARRSPAAATTRRRVSTAFARRTRETRQTGHYDVNVGPVESLCFSARRFLVSCCPPRPSAVAVLARMDDR